MPGVPDEPEKIETLRQKEREKQQKRDARKHLSWSESWHEYKTDYLATFEDGYGENKFESGSNEDNDLPDLLQQAKKNLQHLQDIGRGTVLEKNATFLSQNVYSNIGKLREEIGDDRMKSVLEKTSDFVHEAKQRDTRENAERNLHVLSEFIQEQRREAEKKSVGEWKNELQIWSTELLELGKVAMKEFVVGYKEGKEEIMTKRAHEDLFDILGLEKAEIQSQFEKVKQVVTAATADSPPSNKIEVKDNHDIQDNKSLLTKKTQK